MNGLNDPEKPSVESPDRIDATELYQIDAKLAQAKPARAGASSDEIQRTGDTSIITEIGNRQYNIITEADARLGQARDVLTPEINEQASLNQTAERLSHIEGLRAENWEAASLDQRQQVLEQAGNILSDVYGTTKPIIEIKSLENGFSGFYNAEKDVLTMSKSEVMNADPSIALSTYAHEYRHAYQWDQIERYFHGLPSHSDTATWAENFNNYQKPPTEAQALFDPEGAQIQYDRYRNQPVELDSFSFEMNVVQRVYA